MRVAITGGIGSGKSYVCKRLEAFGIRVYDCDAAAKQLMRTSSALQQDLCRLVGDDVYQAVNQIIHPAVARDFECSGYEWLESAILFDSGFDRRIHFDYIVCVSAPLEIRIQRVMNRDGISREKTMEWISRQLPQEEVLKRANFEIVNDGMEDIDEQILIVLNKMGGTKLPDSTTL